MVPATPRPPHKDDITIRFFHSTTWAGLHGILQDRQLKPGGDDGSGAHGIYGLAHEVQQDPQTDMRETFRVMARAAKLCKNKTGFVFEAMATGCKLKIDSGGISAESALVTKDQFTHHAREKRWCVHETRLTLTAIWLSQQEPLPESTNPPWHWSQPAR